MPKKLFWMTVGLYVIHQLLTQPNWVLGGEMWAEMATNYFHYARSPSWFEKLFATDAGYIPATQRLIALIGYILHIPTAFIPYYYTWTAIILTGMMAGSFCLEPFRKVIPSDLFRFFTGIILLWIVDFETRTFVNFTYFGGYVIAIISALAFADRKHPVPRWSWVIPLLVASKPAISAILPAMIIIAIVHQSSRFRWITAVSLLIYLAQMTLLILNKDTGAFSEPSISISIHKSIIASVQYFFGLLSTFILGIKGNPAYHHKDQIIYGSLIFITCLYVIYKQRNGTSALIFIGLSLLFFNIVLNCTAINQSWNINLTLMDGRVYRHNIIGFQGCVLIAISFIFKFAHTNVFKKLPIKSSYTALLFLLLWFTETSLYSKAKHISNEPNFPKIFNSQWQLLSSEIDANTPHICAPIDPFGWLYPYNCTLIPDFKVNWQNVAYTPPKSFAPPEQLNEKKLNAMAIALKPKSNKNEFIKMQVNIHLSNSSTLHYHAERIVNNKGALIYVKVQDNIPIKDIVSISLDINEPVEVPTTLDTGTPVVLWMGY